LKKFAESTCRKVTSLRSTVESIMIILVSYVEKGLQIQPEFLMIGVSGLLTLQSPKRFRELSLPTLKKITKMAREAYIPSHLHSCGGEETAALLQLV